VKSWKVGKLKVENSSVFLSAGICDFYLRKSAGNKNMWEEWRVESELWKVGELESWNVEFGVHPIFVSGLCSFLFFLFSWFL